MNAIDSSGVSIVTEWVHNELGFGCLHFITWKPFASWSGKSEQSIHVITLEVNWKQELRLKIGWRFVDVCISQYWILIIENLYLILCKLITLNSSINVNWIKSNVQELFISVWVSKFVLAEASCVQSVLVHEDSCFGTGTLTGYWSSTIVV